MNCNKKSHFDGVTPSPSPTPPFPRPQHRGERRWGEVRGGREVRIWICLVCREGAPLSHRHELDAKGGEEGGGGRGPGGWRATG